MLNLTPNASSFYSQKVTDELYAGIGLYGNYGFLTLTRTVDDVDRKEQDHDWAMSYRLGLLMQLTDQTRAGITWNSKTDYDFSLDGKARFPNLPGLPLTARRTVTRVTWP